MGRYIDEILQPGEKVLYSTNAHWRFYLPAIGVWILVAILLVASGLVMVPALMLFCWACAAVAALLALYLTVTAWFHRDRRPQHARRAQDRLHQAAHLRDGAGQGRERRRQSEHHGTPDELRR